LKGFRGFVITSARREVGGSRLALASGVATIFAGAALFLSASSLIPSFSPGKDPIRLNPSAFSWLSQVNVRVAPPTPTAQAVARLTTNVVVPKIEMPPAPPAARARAKTYALKKVLRKRLARVSVPVTAPAPAEPVRVVATEQASALDIQQMQGIHALLRGRFLAAIEPDQLAPVGIQIAEAQPEVEAAPEVIQPKVVRTTRKSAKKAAKPVVVATVEASPEIPKEPEAPTITDEVRFAKAAPSDPITHLITEQDARPESAAVEVDTQPASAGPIIESPPVAVTASQQDDEPAAIPAATPEQPAVTDEKVTSSPSSDEIKPSAQLIAMAPTVTSHAAHGYQATMTDYSPASPGHPVNTQHQGNGPAAERLAKKDRSKTDTQAEEIVASRQAPTVIEAFDWRNTVTSSYTEILSREAPGVNASGWRRTRAESHWPTLHWNSAFGVATLPMIAENTARILAAKLNAPLQADAGIVFGKLPPGWNVELSGRAERPLVLNAQNQPVTGARSDEESYFVFLNAAPGSQMLHLSGPSGGYSGAVALPVMNGAATYLDLSRVQYRAFRGQVLDGSSADTNGIRNVQVRVAGQAGAIAVTDPRGRFSLGRVLVASDLPLYFETDAERGFTHRYRVSPTHSGDLVLYRMADRQIQEWISQLEGGISAESGLVVAALPSLVAAQPDGILAARMRTLAMNPTLAPELYTLGTLGELQVGVPLSPERTRFLSLQVPDGPAVIGAEGSAGKPVWGELIMASPGVVNMVGPY
jgi:hypothetical protein